MNQYELNINQLRTPSQGKQDMFTNKNANVSRRLNGDSLNASYRCARRLEGLKGSAEFLEDQTLAIWM